MVSMAHPTFACTSLTPSSSHPSSSSNIITALDVVSLASQSGLTMLAKLGLPCKVLSKLLALSRQLSSLLLATLTAT